MNSNSQREVKDMKTITIEELLQLDQDTITVLDVVLQMHIPEALYRERSASRLQK